MAWALLAAALCVQLRLLCNLLDGMVAIEGKRQSPTGALFNEGPGSFGGLAVHRRAGLCRSHAPALGWFGALAAAVTAYIRVLGGSLGLPQDFRGPMAKPHRMAVLTGCLRTRCESSGGCRQTRWALLAGGMDYRRSGSVITCITRLVAIARQLRARSRHACVRRSFLFIGAGRNCSWARSRAGWAAARGRRSESTSPTTPVTSTRWRSGQRCRSAFAASRRPVAARDYWGGGFRRYLATKTLRAVLIDRARSDPNANPLAPLDRDARSKASR